MLPNRVSNPGPLTYESDALPIALRGTAQCKVMQHLGMRYSHQNMYTWLAILPAYEQHRSKQWIDDTQHYVLIKSISVIQDDVRMKL